MRIYGFNGLPAVAPSLLVGLALASAAQAQSIVPRLLAPGVWMVQGHSALGSAANRNFISNSAFVVTGEGVVVIDSLGSPVLAEELVAAVRRVTPLPIKEVIVTHYHADHVYGLQVFERIGARITAHADARPYLHSDAAALRLEASRKELAPAVDERTRLVAATQWLTAPWRFALGGVNFVVQPMGPAHTAEDLVVHLPQQQVLVAGDLVFRGRVPFVGQADSARWVDALDRLIGFGARTIIPGHGPPTDDAQSDLALTRDYLLHLRRTMGEAARKLEPFDEAYARTDWSRYESLPLFKAANRMNAYNTYLLMEQSTK